MEQNQVKPAAKGMAVCKTDDAVLTSEVDVYGAQADGQSPCIIVRQGEDPAPTCVNPQCPRQLNCRRHIHNREDKRTPTIAIITYADCTWYNPIKK
jgi:hypothetical protein